MTAALDVWSLKQRVAIVFKQAIPANLLTILVLCVFSYAIKDQFTEQQPLNWYWFALTTSLCVLRSLVALAYHLDNDRFSTLTWARLYIFSTALVASGIALSSAFYLLVEDDMARSSVMLLQVGMVAGAMVILNAMPRVFIAYATPIFFGMFISLSMDDHHWSPYLLVGFSLYLIFNYMAVTNSFRHTANLLELQYKNRSLVSDLSVEIQHRTHAQEKLVKHQHELEELVDKRTLELRRNNDALSREIQRRKEVEENLKHLAHHDALTKLPNRLLLNDRLDHLLFQATRHGRRGAVLFIDLNGFKAINDQYGHDVGDRLLELTAQRLKENLRQEDTISRYGGDEFVVLTEFSDEESAITLSDKIISLFQTDFETDGLKIQLGCSIGVSQFPEHSTDADMLMKMADEAMYEAKEVGRNAFRIYLG